MDKEFKKAFARLNAGQKKAVETIDGPVLVIAGPGTGKTQLLGTRAGYILKNTDTRPSEILCLTFTNAASDEMRQRFINMVGQDGYSINLYTYHAFGGEILHNWSQYFDGQQLDQIDDLAKDMLMREIIAGLPYSDPLKYADNYMKDVKDFIADAKQALLSPDKLLQISKDNLATLERLNKAAGPALAKMATVSKKTVPVFEELLQIIFKDEGELAKLAARELSAALESFAVESKATGLLSDWKKKWLAKDSDGNFIFAGKRENEKLAAAAGIYRRYQQELKSRRLYDYEDMILRAIEALEANPDFKYSLAENYQYIMLDEFQDTNPAQMRLVELLSDHPVHEGSPNILAVGDDDQAIYAFQGADHANMAGFAKLFKNTLVISLEENYRSQPEILDTARGIAEQISERLHHSFKGLEKTLKAANKNLPGPARISVREFISDAAEQAWVAKEIKRLISKEGYAPSDIAVLAPKHRHLEPLLPHLAGLELAVRYDKREDVIEYPIIHELVQMSRLVLALGAQNESLASELWPQVLSYDFWDLPTELIWQISWEARQSHQPWTAILLKNKKTRPVALFFLELKAKAPQSSLEQMLDALIGLPETSSKLKLANTSPLFEHYFGASRPASDAAAFVGLATGLSILRDRLRDYMHSAEGILGLEDFVTFVEGRRAAGLSILNESPYWQTANAVNLMTAYAAKGREFRAVFLIAASDEVWGSSSRNQGSRLPLPQNLKYIRYQGASEDERLRLLFVSATRARTDLYLSAHTQTLSGKKLRRLKYLGISESELGEALSSILPTPFAKIIADDTPAITPLIAKNYWTERHLPPLQKNLRDVLKPRLDKYQLSATDLNRFIDLERAGPAVLFLKSILGFPEAPTSTSIYGTAMHNSLKWLGGELGKTGKLPLERTLIEFYQRELTKNRLAAEEYEQLLGKGQETLGIWLKTRAKELSPKDRYEYDFKDEGVLVGSAHLQGKVDRLSINETDKTLVVVDYKTGRAYQRWEASSLRLHKFKQQLMFYKLLVEGSAKFASYRVDGGIIEFVDHVEGTIVKLPLSYNEAEIEGFKQLIEAVWGHIQKSSMPDTSGYSKSLGQIKVFEQDLIDGKI